MLNGMDAGSPTHYLAGHTRGRLFGRNVLEALFRATPDEDLFLGELLVGVDEATGRRYLFRVVDVSYGSEHREPGWAERVAGTLLADDARGDTGAHPLHEQARRTYRLAECRCLGYLAPPATPGRARTVFRKPKSLPTQFSRVVSPTPEDFAFLAGRMGDLPIGRLRSGETVVDFAVGVPGKSLASHVGIFATTGMGKSNLLEVTAAGVMSANGRYGLLIIDPHGEHRSALGRHPWADLALRTYSDRRLPNTSTLRISLAELSVDDLRTAYEWSRPQEEALHELERHYSAALPRSESPDRFRLKSGLPAAGTGRSRRARLAGRVRSGRGPGRLQGRRTVGSGGPQYAPGRPSPGQADRGAAVHLRRPGRLGGRPHPHRPAGGQSRPRRCERSRAVQRKSSWPPTSPGACWRNGKVPSCPTPSGTNNCLSWLSPWKKHRESCRRTRTGSRTCSPGWHERGASSASVCWP